MTTSANIKEYLLLAALVVAGLLLIVLQQSLPDRHWAISYLNAISSTLLMGGLLGVLYKKYIDGEHYKELKKILKIHESISESGLLEYRAKNNDFNYSKLITDSKYLTVIVNDGHRWVTTHANDLRDRFNSNSKTVFLHLDESNPFVHAVSAKVGYSLDQYISKLETARVELIKLYEESKKIGSLEIFMLKTYPTQAIYLTEKELVVTPYQTCSKRLNVPVYIFDATNENKGYFKDVKKDLNHILKESKKVFPNKQRDAQTELPI